MNLSPENNIHKDRLNSLSPNVFDQNQLPLNQQYHDDRPGPSSLIPDEPVRERLNKSDPEKF